MRILIKKRDHSLSKPSRLASWAKIPYCLCLLLAPGCQLVEWDAFSDVSTVDARQTSPKALYHNNRGLKYLAHGKIGKAETHFLKAVEYDPGFAAAHNNLGNMYLSRRDLYQAAWEFQRASQIAPNSVEPLLNLGMLHDEADRLEEAADFYLQALEIDPRNTIAIGNLARVRIKQEYDPTEIQGLLRELVFLETRPDWLDWAQELLATRYRDDYGVKPSVAGPQMPLGQNAVQWMEQGALQFPVPPWQQEPIQPQLPIEDLPQPVQSAPRSLPTLMDIPSIPNGIAPFVVKPGQP